MSRKFLTIVVGIAAGLALVASVVAGQRQRSAERDAELESRRANAMVRRTAAIAPTRVRSQRPTKVCPRGAEGLGNSARRSIRRKLMREDGRVDRQALSEMSNIAIAAGRYLERARAAPALPQRMGRQRTTGPDGKPTWQALAYPTIGCALVSRMAEPPPAD